MMGRYRTPFRQARRAAALMVGLGAAAASVASQEHEHSGAGHPTDTIQAAPLFHDLGNHHLPITTPSSAAQAYFDQGLRLQYGFNHAEAIRSYQTALSHDPQCAMCWWGIALAAGPNINGPMSVEGGRLAYQASREAAGLLSGLTSWERDLVNAIGERYAADPNAPRAPLDSAYASAMGLAASRQDAPPDVLTLYGSALMNLSPWNYWDGDWSERRPRAGTDHIVDVLRRAVATQPDNPGACHYWIHLMEAAHPAEALPCAERLTSLMPGAGHISHMPGHVYIRVGRYADAVRVNDHAAHSDESYMADMGIRSLYTGAYYPHNYHFMAFAATMAGMSEKAMEAARFVAPRVPHDVAREVYWIQNAVVLPALTMVTFGRWEDVLKEPIPAEDLTQAWILAHYARGVALAALGRPSDARQELRLVEEAAHGAGDPSTAPIGHIARYALAGEISMRAGDAAAAVEHFGEAVAIEDELLYDEPPLWYYPMRHSLGRALLEAGNPRRAEAEFRRELAKFPGNGWSLLGLAMSLEAQNRLDEAREVRERFAEAWADADVTLSLSRF